MSLKEGRTWGIGFMTLYWPLTPDSLSGSCFPISANCFTQENSHDAIVPGRLVIGLGHCFLSVFLFCFVLRCYLFVYFWPCPVACRILFPRPGIKPSTSAVKVQSLNNHWTTREVPCLFLFLKNQVLFFKLFAFYWSMADLIILG